MRVTEQGEVVSLKFANRGTAQNNLEVLTASVLLHTLKSADDQQQRVVPEHQAAVEDIARLSFKAYRKLAEDPGLLSYFQSASPVEELALLKIGSRPSRRLLSSLTRTRPAEARSQRGNRASTTTATA